VSDKRVWKLVQALLTAGAMEGGLVSPVDEGMPQGGLLSRMLRNIVLDEFDGELKRRGLRFARSRTMAKSMSAAVGLGNE